MELSKGVWTCNPLMPVHVSRGLAVVDLGPFWAPFGGHFGSPVRHYTPFWSPLSLKQAFKIRMIV